MVQGAQAEQTETEQFVDRFAGYYTPVVVVLAILTAAVPPLLIDTAATVEIAGLAHSFEGDWGTWFVRGLTLLVIACPCAFVISTPVSVVSGITSAAKNGVLIKGGNYLEAMGEVDAVALDKTGTLTKGELAVTDVVPADGGDADDLLRHAAALERRSEHPIARAILDRAEEASVDDLPEPSAFESLTGKGVRAEIDGETYYAGKPALFEDLGFDLSRARAETDGGVVETGDRDRQSVASDDGAFADGAILATGAHTLWPLKLEGLTERAAVFQLHRRAVDMQDTVFELNTVAGQPDDTFDEIRPVHGMTEYSDIAALRLLAEEPRIVPTGPAAYVLGVDIDADGGNAHARTGRVGVAIGHLVDEQEIPDQQRVLHGPGRDPERLEKDRAEHPRDQQCIDDGLDRLGDCAAFFLLFSHVLSPNPLPATCGAGAGLSTRWRSDMQSLAYSDVTTGRASIRTKACAQG